MGIQVCENEGAGTYWGPIRGQKGSNVVIFKKSSFHELAVQIL